MTCKKIRSNLIEYLEKRRDLPVFEDVQKHLLSCPECAAFKLKLDEALCFIEWDKKVVSDPHMHTRIQAMRMQSHPIPRYIMVNKLLKSVSIAAMLIFIIFIGSVIGRKYYYKQSIASDYQTELYYFSNIHMDNHLFAKLSEQNPEQ